MKRVHGLVPLVLVFTLSCLGPVSVARAVAGDADETTAEAAPPSVAARARQLAADVREFARAPGLSHAKREKRIATAVRVAVVAATAYRQSADEVLGAATELAAAATRAAPAYADVIANAAAYAPSVARIEGAGGQIRTAASAAAKGGRAHRVARNAADDREEPTVRQRRAPAADSATSENPGGAAGTEVATDDPGPRHRLEPADTAEPAGDKAMTGEEADRTHGKADVDRSLVFSATTDISVRHDDNIFLATTNKVGDTIVTATPGVGMHWGQNSLAHGGLDYKESFVRYTGKTAPNVSLGTAAGSFAYDDGGTNFGLGANYQQLYQSNADVLAAGLSELIRTNIFDANTSFGTELGTKMGMSAGAALTDTKYKTGGLIGNRNTGVPLNLFYKITPKTDLSLGYTYGTQRPDDGGASSKDNYFNLGARGEFTPKLSGTFSLGYQTRKVADNPADKIFAFNGAFKYELTPKTGATLTLTRNFNASALGATTTNSVYRLDFNTDLSSQWQLGAGLAYLDNDYGQGVFRADSSNVAALRTDKTWQANLIATYIYSQWLWGSLSYSLNNNRSTLPGLDFSSNVVNLTLGLRY